MWHALRLPAPSTELFTELRSVTDEGMQTDRALHREGRWRRRLPDACKTGGPDNSHPLLRAAQPVSRPNRIGP
jgi:hypothetical protein